MAIRQAKCVLHATEVEEGPGFRIRRAIPQQQLDAVGPFLLLDQIGPRIVSPGALTPLGAHPHAGMETLTYLVEGSTEHHDSAGHSETIHGGEIQWMRAGRGIVHTEGPGRPLRERGGPLHAIQLWINLPKGRKHVDPAYRSYRGSDVSPFRIGDSTVRLLAGSIGGRTGPVVSFADPFALHAAFAGRGTSRIEVPDLQEIALYVMTGSVSVGDEGVFATSSIVVLGGEGGFSITAHERSDVLVFGGPALEARVVRHGPFVMNCDEEIEQALRDYRRGRMGSLPRVA